MINLNNKELLAELDEELKLRKYSKKTIRKYLDLNEKFLKSGKTVRKFLLDYSSKSNSMKSLQNYYENKEIW